MKHRLLTTVTVIVASLASADLIAARQQKQAPQPDMCVVPPGAQPLLPAKLLPGMGTITDFAVTTKSEEARRFFLQGLAQIHSFWFTESERSCAQAAELDPDMAMAHWCIALSAASDYRPAFQLLRNGPNGGGGRGNAGGDAGDTVQRTTNGAAVNPQIRAKEAIAKAVVLKDKVTPRERLYIESQAARRASGPKDQADAAYIAGLRKIVAEYPSDLHAKAMLGLAIDNGFDSVTREPREHTMEAIALLTDVVAKDDANFGAHHYLIHAWEGSKTPQNAWRDCERYPQLVPNIPHALHMPGHIYAQSDKIPEAVAAFSAARENELKWIDADTLYPTGHHGHNVHFLIHSLNLSGRYQDSMTQVQHLMSFKETGPDRQGYFGLIKSVVRFEKWNEILDGRTVPVYDQPQQNAWRHWATGLAYAAKGDMEKAKSSLVDMEKALETSGRSEPLTIGAQELAATIAARGGDRKKGYDLFRKAADREAAMLYTEPPSYPRPVAEGWANVALAIGDFATAEKEYEEALTREPGSGRAYFGLSAALNAQGKASEAAATRAKALKAWAKADQDLPQLKQTTSTAAGQR
jgi:tetratricopeptide (TPR) repeat protein